MTIEQAMLEATRERSKKKAFQVLDWMEKKSFANPQDFMWVCDINRTGEDGHEWAKDTFDEWQWDGVEEAEQEAEA